MLSDFMDNVVALGADAVLPHNLSDTWLAPLCRAAIRFLGQVARELPENPDQDPLDLFEDMDGSLFLAAITELLQSRYDYPAHFQMETLPEGVLFESIACYAMYVILEDISRTHDISYPLPDADTLLEPEAIREIESGSPRISEILHAMFHEKENAAE